jgi:hypothetical protein
MKAISLKICSLVTSVFYSMTTLPVYADPCNASKELENKIISCRDNVLAPQYGRECLTIIKKESEVVSAALRKAVASHNRQVLKDAINQTTEQIKTMQSQAANVADYAQTMIDFPDSYRRETSAECFNTNFDKLQKVVDEIDNQIILAKRAYKAAVDRLGK